MTTTQELRDVFTLPDDLAQEIQALLDELRPMVATMAPVLERIGVALTAAADHTDVGIDRVKASGLPGPEANEIVKWAFDVPLGGTGDLERTLSQLEVMLEKAREYEMAELPGGVGS